MARKSDKPEQPRVEPEIIPPDRAGSGLDWRRPAWQPYGTGQTSGTYRVYVGRIGPFGIAMLALAFVLLTAVIVFAVVGAILVWIPVLALLLAGAAVFRFLRR
jgi:hypothetical protein